MIGVTSSQDYLTMKPMPTITWRLECSLIFYPADDATQQSESQLTLKFKVGNIRNKHEIDQLDKVQRKKACQRKQHCIFKTKVFITHSQRQIVSVFGHFSNKESNGAD
jgi:hypothetical protein